MHNLDLQESVGLLAQEDYDIKIESQNEVFGRSGRVAIPDAILSYASKSSDYMKRLLLFLAPSFVTARLGSPVGRLSKLEVLRPTAYLDGLRGLAAWAVFNAHLSALLTKTSGGAYGLDGSNTELYKLPIVRLIYDGDFAVALFFIISGYALSLGPLAMMRAQPRNSETAMRKLAGSIMRRPIRLYFPAWASMIIAFALVRSGIFGFLLARQTYFEQYLWGWTVIDEWPVKMPSFNAQFLDVFKGCFNLLEIFKAVTDADFGVHYNGVLWTVKLEFRCSFVLYLTHTAIFYMRKPVRVAVVCLLILLGNALWSFDFPLFWFGYILAECQSLSSDNKPSLFSLKSLKYWILIALGGLLGSFPAWHAIGTPYYSLLIPYTPFNFLPYERWWTSLGAAIVIFCIPKLPPMMKIYESRLVQYLGKISFSFYLVHFWIVHIFGTLIFFNVWSITGKNGILPTCTGFVIAYALLLSCTVWISDLFWRCIDKPSLDLAAKLERLMFQEA